MDTYSGVRSDESFLNSPKKISLNDETAEHMNIRAMFPKRTGLKVGPLHTPLSIDRKSLKKIQNLEIVAGTETYNIKRILSGCSQLKSLRLENAEKEGLDKLFNSVKYLPWRNITSLELLCTQPSPLFTNTIEPLKLKRFPHLVSLKFVCRVPNRAKLQVYHKVYIDIHQFIVTNKHSLRKLTMIHELGHGHKGSPMEFYSNNESHRRGTVVRASTDKVITNLQKALIELPLTQLIIQFTPLESTVDWFDPRFSLDIDILKGLFNLQTADLDFSETTFWLTKGKDFSELAHNNRFSLKKLRVKVDYCEDGFDCVFLKNFVVLEYLTIESVWSILKNVQYLPNTLTSLELHLPTKPAQKTWIANNLNQLEYLTVEQSLQDPEDHPVLPMLRLPIIKSLTVNFCPEKKAKEMTSFCRHHRGVVMKTTEVAPTKYFNFSRDFGLTLKMTIDTGIYIHKLRYEKEETQLELD